MRLIYSLVMYLAVPLLLLHLALRGLRNRDYLRRWRERFAFITPPPATGGIVVHAVSVGEVNAASPLVRELARQRPDMPLTLTCFTPTGSDRISTLYGETAHHVYAPLDLPGSVRRFLDRVRPRMLVIMETEIWANLYLEAHKRGIPILIANARISDRSARGYRRWKGLTSTALNAVSRIAAQSDIDARRLVELGAPPQRLEVTGNLKFDVRLPPAIHEQGELLRVAWGAGRPVLVAGSTHEDDEEPVLDAFRKILGKHPDALLVMAPRHPERFARGCAALRDLGFRVSQRSQGEPCDAGTQVYLADTMGELLQLYAAGDIAFVGGSLANVGGQNVLEPASLAKPVLVGPHTQNFVEITDQLLSEGGALRVSDALSLAHSCLELFASADRRDKMGQAGRSLVDRGRGSLEKTLLIVDELLQQPTDP